MIDFSKKYPFRNSFLDLIYKLPLFGNGGCHIPNEYGIVNEQLNGNVRIAIQSNLISQSLHDGETTMLYLDKDGKVCSKTILDKDSNLIKTVNYIYNSIGKCVEMRCTNSSGEIESRATYSYDENGLIIRNESFGKNDEYRGNLTYKYDSNNLLIDECWNSRNTIYDWKCAYRYNENEQEIEMLEYKGKNKLFSRKLKKVYDTHGNLKEHLNINSDGTVEKLIVDAYDEDGRVIQVFFSNHSILNVDYDSHGRLVKFYDPRDKECIKILYHDNFVILEWMKINFTVFRRQIISYDENNNVTSFSEYDGDNLDLVKKIVWKYEYNLD